MVTSSGQIMAKATLSSKQEYIVNLDPKEYPLEALRQLTVNDVVNLQELD